MPIEQKKLEDLIKDNPEGACELFNKVIQLEEELNVDKW